MAAHIYHIPIQITERNGYRVTEPAQRIAMTLREPSSDRRDPEVVEDYTEWVRETVRAMRLRDLQQCWDERYLSAFDQLVEMFHGFDPDLYLRLDDAPKLRAETILRRSGWLP